MAMLQECGQRQRDEVGLAFFEEGQDFACERSIQLAIA